MTAPSGPGVFLWLPDRCEKGDVGAVAAKAKECGVRWIALQNFCAATYVARLKSEGLWVAFSGYSTPQGTQDFLGKARLAVQCGCDGILVDAELEWELADDRKIVAHRGPEAHQFMADLRASIGPNVFIGDAGCWAEPKFHPTYPDGEFGWGCDAAMPERYWTESTTAYGPWMAESEREWETTGKLYKAIVPIGSGYGTNGPVPGGHQALRPTDFGDFIDRYPTFGLWSWMHLPDWAWAALKLKADQSKPYSQPIAIPDVPIDLTIDPPDTPPPQAA